MAAEDDASLEPEQQVLADGLDALEDTAVEDARDPRRLPTWVRALRRQALPDEGLEPRCGAMQCVAFRHKCERATAAPTGSAEGHP